MLNSIVAFLESGVSGSYESIATATGTGSSNTITFSSIPSTYKHLQIRIIARATQATAVRGITFTANNDTSTNYAKHTLSGDGATVTLTGQGSLSAMGTLTIPAASTASGIYGVYVIDIHDYESTTKAKTLKTFGGYDANGSGISRLTSDLWTSTAAINRLDFLTNGTAFDTTTTFSLYGIKGA